MIFLHMESDIFLSKGSQSRKILQVMELQGCQCDLNVKLVKNIFLVSSLFAKIG